MAANNTGTSVTDWRKRTRVSRSEELMEYLDSVLTELKREYLRKWGAKIMSEEAYHCSVHGEVTDVMKMAFDSSILRDPTTHAYERIERIYCIACYVAFMDQQLGEITPMVKYTQQEPSDEYKETEAD